MKKTYFTKEHMYGWHFRKGPGLSYRDPRVPKVGERLQAQTSSGLKVTRPGLCAPGLHAFPKLESAGSYAAFGSTLSFVLLENVVGRKNCDKVSAQYRTILWQGEVPASVGKNKSDLAEWLKSVGFKRASATAKARVLRAKRARK